MFPLPDNAVDRVVCTYLLDLLSENDINRIACEAHRVLMANGKFCLISLTRGETFISGIVSGLWSMLFHIYAPLVGGCRPVRLEPLIDRQNWSIEYHHVVTPVGVPSEILIAKKVNESS